MRYLRFVPLGLLALMALVAAPVPPAHAATFTVDSTGDGVDANPGNGTCATAGAVCTLRAAIEEANALAGTDMIAFNIAGAGPHTISPGSALPAIYDPLTIDGTSEPDFAGTPIVELDGSSAGAAVHGLLIWDVTSTVKGLVINRFGSAGIALGTGGGANTIEGNYIGTDVTGTVALGNDWGVVISDNAANTIGGTAAGARNVISGNLRDGVEICGNYAMWNKVEGNYIGTDVTGTAALGNGQMGVEIDYAPSNTIGGAAAGAGNVIASNNGHGVYIWGSIATGNTVQGNSIHSNGGKGIRLFEGGNTELTPPVVTGVGSASGTACPNCTVDVYSDDADEGGTYHGSTVADGSGNWSYPGAVSGPNVTATATDAGGNTSEFSAPCADTDGDTICQSVDNCPNDYNPGQENNVHPGTPEGDHCEDPEPDGVADITDNCPDDANPDQLDSDSHDGGDVCDPCPNDDTDTCDTNRSAAASIGPSGGSLTTPDASVSITVPPGALPTDTTISITGGTDTGFILIMPPDWLALAVYEVDIQPSGTVFAAPVTVVFAWDDTDNNGYVDGTDITEASLYVAKDGTLVTGYCLSDPGCDLIANTFTFTVTSLSDFILLAPKDSDGDGVADNFDGVVDNCPDTANAGQENPDGDAWGTACENCPAVATPWWVVPGDTDCDAFTDGEEGDVGTDPADWCPDDPADDTWPSDYNMDAECNILDIVQWTPPAFNVEGPDPPYETRKDFNADNWLNILDIVRLTPPMFNTTCVP